jgi:hypothetical protein
LGIETANQGGSHERKALPMSPHSNRTSARQDVYAEITSQLVAAIEVGPGRPSLPLRKSSGALFMPVNALTHNAYNGVNVVSLWVAAEVKNFTSPVWATYKQWLELGAQVRKDEKSSLVIFYKEFDTDPNPQDASDDGKRRVARASRVFNASQVDGYEAAVQPDPPGPIERIAAAGPVRECDRRKDRSRQRPRLLSSCNRQDPDAFGGCVLRNRNHVPGARDTTPRSFSRAHTLVGCETPA